MTAVVDYPLDECAKTAQQIIDDGGTVYQKFSCANCRSRQTMDVPNVFFTHGTCQECGHVTDIQAQGCNYLAHFRI